MKKVLLKRCAAAAAVLVVTASLAWAKPLMEITMSVTKEVVETVNGKKVNKQVPASEAVSGDTLTYTLVYKNNGDETASNTVINNPVPSGSAYVGNSAAGVGSEITFSTDNGKTYDQAVKLSYEMHRDGKVVKRTATPDDYTHIRWTIREVPAGSGGTLSFMVKVK